jgi:hypothetical protein
MRDMPVRVVNALCELHQIIEEVRKNYAQNKQYNKTIQISLKNWRSSNLKITANILNSKPNNIRSKNGTNN